MTAPIQTPLPVPARLDAAPPAKLSEKEQAQYDRVLAHFSDSDYVLSGVDPENATLTEEERMWLSYECILRYLRAARYDPSESIKRLEATLKWRRDFGLFSSDASAQLEPEALTGKMFAFGYDTQGRPALYYCPNRQNTEETPRQLQYIFWCIERAIDLMGPGVESVAIMVDYADTPKGPSFSMARQILNILQTHYPERLGTAIIAHIHWLLHTFWKLIMPLMDPVTRSKLVFNPVTDDDGLWRSAEARDQGQADAQLSASDQLLSEGWAGSVEFTYNHEMYWSALLSLTEARRNDLTRVWRQLGGVVGIREWDVKVGVRDGLTEPAAADGARESL